MELATLLPRVDIIEGDAGEQSVLENEMLSSVNALITLTDVDELNMVISLYGNQRRIPQIITRVDRIGDTKLVNQLPLGSVISPNRLCCNTIVRYVRAMQNQEGAALTVHAIADGHAEAMEFRVDECSLHCGVPLKKLKLKKNVLLVSISGASGTEIAGGDSVFTLGDSVVVVASGDQKIRQFNDIFA